MDRSGLLGHYLLRHSSFWDIYDNTTRGSWMWKKILKLRPLAATFIRKEIHNGLSTHFWFDNWFSIGPLRSILGDLGTRILGIHKNAKVAEVVDENGRRFGRVRGIHAQEVLDVTRSVHPPFVLDRSDRNLWKQSTDFYESKFSSKRTWNLLRAQGLRVAWYRLVWFPQAIPRQAFIVWLTVRDRLSTGARMRAWGISQPCPLCGEQDETRDHLFLACSYTYTVWTMLVSHILGPRISRRRTTQLLLRNRLSSLDKLLVLMTFQSLIYWIWRERNGRVHNNPPHSTLFTSTTIHKEMLHRLLAYDTEVGNRGESLTRWSSVSQLNHF